MTSIVEALARARYCQGAGQLAQAEQLYRQILTVDPKCAEGWRQLGIVTKALGRPDEAIGHFRQALAADPNHGDTYSDLGIALANQGKLEDAAHYFKQGLQRNPSDANAANNVGVILGMCGRPEEAAVFFRQAIAVQPSKAGYHANLGNALCEAGHDADAVASYRQAVQLDPREGPTYHGLGNALFNQGNMEEAIACYRQCLRLAPNYFKALHGLGSALADQGKHDEARASFQQALLFKPDFAEAHHGLGMALAELGQLEEASASYRRALQLKPDYADAHNNLGNVLLLQDKRDEAIGYYLRALELRPEFPEAHKNLGNAHYSLGKLDEAMAHYDKALQLKSDNGEVHWNRSLVRLLRGDFEQGWPEYEWRWTQPGFLRRSFQQPRWDGADLEGRTIFLYAEQGLGDTIQFIRYASLVKERGGNVTFECPLPLMRLLANFSGIDRLVVPGLPAGPFDVQAPLLSLPGIMGTSLESIPAAIPYLHADSELVEHWRCELDPLPGIKVGIAWQGSPANRRDRERSFPLTHFARLAQVNGVQLVSLQKGPGADQLRALAGQFPVHDLGGGLDEASGAFMDTAAVMRNLDLVISSDTAIAHLAGALGVAVWVALPYIPDWRWLLQRTDSPWYPTMRLFRQARLGSWDEVFERMAAELSLRL